jgi:DNA polymerase-3 subunit beta
MSIDKNEIKSILPILKKVIDTKKNNPLFHQVMFDGRNITVTDLQNVITYRREQAFPFEPCVVDFPNLAVLTPVDTKDKGAWELSLLPKSNGSEGKELSCKDGEMEVKIESYSDEDYPEIPTLDGISENEFSTKALIKSISYCLPAMSDDQTRPTINGMCFVDDKIISTNGHVLHWTPSGISLPEGVEWLINSNAIEIILAILKSEKQESLCTITDPHEGSVRFSCGNWIVIAKLIEAKFPPYNQVIPKRSEHNISVDNRKLEKALKRVDKMQAGDRVRSIILTSQSASIELAADSSTGNRSSSVSIPADVSNPCNGDCRIGFQCEYLLDAITYPEAEYTTILHDGPLDPILVYPGGSSGVGAVVMPMRI